MSKKPRAPQKTNEASPETQVAKPTSATTASTPTAKPGVVQPRGVKKWVYSLFDEVDNSTLVAFRVMWGLIMAYEAWTYIQSDYMKLVAYYLSSDFHPTYYLFEWVKPLEGNGMYYFIWIMLVSGLNVAIGLLYRLSATVFFLCWMYLILMDASLYLNHFYLIAVMAFILILLPANRRWAVDSMMFPNTYTTTMPRIIILMIRAELVIVYFFAGVAKINEDWLRAEPIRHWIFGHVNDMRLAPDSTVKYVLSSDLFAYFICYAGLLLDLFVGFTLCFPRGFIFYVSVLASCGFHISNKLLFNIGIFPPVMIASTFLFFEPDWPAKTLNFFRIYSVKPSIQKPFQGPLALKHKIILLVLTLFFIHQLAMPLRHHLYPDNVAWNEMGHRYSWRMKLRDKICDIQMIASLPEIDKKYSIKFESYLYGKQARKIKPNPQLVIQYAHFVADQVEQKTGMYPEIYAKLACSLNYRRPQLIFYKDVDLARVDPHDWSKFGDIITPLEPLTEEEKLDLPWNFTRERWLKFWNEPFHPSNQTWMGQNPQVL